MDTPKTTEGAQHMKPRTGPVQEYPQGPTVKVKLVFDWWKWKAGETVTVTEKHGTKLIADKWATPAV